MHLKNRPDKKIFEKEKVELLKNKAIDKIKSKLLPDKKIIKIVLIGSSLKNSFGKYEEPGFRASRYSDFDFIVFVEDDYKIPEWLNKEESAKPFQEDSFNLAYRNKEFVEDKYDVEVFFIKKSSMQNMNFRREAEKAGIPVSKESKNKFEIIYSNKK